MDEFNREFASDLIKKYGEDRFYHSCLRTSNDFATAEMWLMLNWSGDLTAEENHRNCSHFLESIGIHNVPPFVRARFPTIEFVRTDLCRISFGFCRWWKEFGLKTHKLPTNIHARMVLGENNEWVKSYIGLLERFPEW